VLETAAIITAVGLIADGITIVGTIYDYAESESQKK